MRILIPIVAVVVATGCSNNVPAPQAQKVMNAAITTTVTADGKVVSANWTPTNGSVDVTINNALGTGTAHVTGQATNTNGTVTTAVGIDFVNWQDILDNLVLNGTLTESGSFTTTAPLAGNIKINGALASSGSVNATVDFDVQGDYGPTGLDISGDVGGNVLNGSFSVSAH